MGFETRLKAQQPIGKKASLFCIAGFWAAPEKLWGLSA